MDDEKEEPSVSYRFYPGKFIDFLTLSDQEKAEKATKFLIALIKGDSSICSDAKEMILEAMVFRSKKSAAGKAAMDSRYGSKDPKPALKPKRPPNVSPDGEVIEQAEIEFETFRVAFPGTRAGHDSALKIFKNVVGKSWKEIVPKLLPAVESEKAWHKKCDDVGAWHQPWAMLTTWIRQRRWEQEFTEPVAPPASKRAQPKTFAQIEEEEREQSYRDAEARINGNGK